MTNLGYIAKKVYVTVVARFEAQGGVVPLEIIWEDGRHFKIDAVVERAFHRDEQSGGRNLRYTVVVAGREREHRRFLWQDETGRWYVNEQAMCA